MEVNKVYCGDCQDILKTLPENSVDSICCDPPYELGFMGKSWDNTGIANNKEMWAECLRVLKPGGHLLSFSGTRTYHRMASAIEDAGFEVRDMIEWVYGSGFPKSLNIGKAVDKLQGNDREWISESPFKASEEAELATHGKCQTGRTTHPDITKGTSEWEGWGTALKPAHEPICMARKPLAEKTVAENVLKWGTGGINIDESRVGTDIIQSVGTIGKQKFQVGNNNPVEVLGEHTGRFPANLILSDCEEVRECFPESGKGNGKGAYNYAGREYDNKDTSMFNGDKPQAPSNFNDSGNASRFFKSIIYQAKASKSERNNGCEGLEDKFRAGLVGADRDTDQPLDDVSERFRTQPAKNNHPTVKPIALMEYLIKMVTPKGGIVLDPFAGSGSTLVAAKQNGFQYIGIEMTEEYIPIIEARLK